MSQSPDLSELLNRRVLLRARFDSYAHAAAALNERISSTGVVISRSGNLRMPVYDGRMIHVADLILQTGDETITEVWASAN